MRSLRAGKMRRGYSGQSAVEFALVFPIILLVILGIIEFSRVIFTYAAVSMASREGARFGASVGENGTGTPHYLDCAGVRSAARRLGAFVGVQVADITINYDHGPGTAQFATCPTTASQVSLGDRIIVRVNGSYSPLPVLPLVGMHPFQMNSISYRTIIKDIELGYAATASGGGGGGGAAATNTPITPGAATSMNTPVNPATPTWTIAPPAATNTPVPPAAPLAGSVNWTTSGNKCNSIIWRWLVNPAWTTYPAASVTQYQYYKGGAFQFNVTPLTASATTGVNLNNGGTVTFGVQAVFPGPLAGAMLSQTFIM